MAHGETILNVVIRQYLLFLVGLRRIEPHISWMPKLDGQLEKAEKPNEWNDCAPKSAEECRCGSQLGGRNWYKGSES